MEEPPRSPDGNDRTWIDTWVAPPHREDIEKLRDAFGSVEDASPYLTLIKRHVVDSPLRDELGITLYDETAWGVIRWSRAIGRPVTPTLAAGFGIVHEYDFSFEVGPPEDRRRIGGWIDAGQPQVWDGPEDDDVYTVNFMLRGIRKWTNRVVIGSGGVQWQPADEPWMTQRHRYVTYPASCPNGEFTVQAGAAPKDLGIFEVIRSW